MSSSITCEHCGRRLRIRDEAADVWLTFPNCLRGFLNPRYGGLTKDAPRPARAAVADEDEYGFRRRGGLEGDLRNDRLMTFGVMGLLYVVVVLGVTLFLMYGDKSALAFGRNVDSPLIFLGLAVVLFVLGIVWIARTSGVRNAPGGFEVLRVFVIIATSVAGVIMSIGLVIIAFIGFILLVCSGACK